MKLAPLFQQRADRTDAVGEIHHVHLNEVVLDITAEAGGVCWGNSSAILPACSTIMVHWRKLWTSWTKYSEYFRDSDRHTTLPSIVPSGEGEGNSLSLGRC